MEKQGIIPPWVRQVAPTVLNLLTNADASADDKKALKTAAASNKDQSRKWQRRQ